MGGEKSKGKFSVENMKTGLYKGNLDVVEVHYSLLRAVIFFKLSTDLQ
jgi:hypothetical protein